MRAVPVGVASIVPHVTVRGNGGGCANAARGNLEGSPYAARCLPWGQRAGAVAQFRTRCGELRHGTRALRE